MSNLSSLSSLLRRTLALGAVLGAGTAIMHAQAPAADTNGTPSLNLSLPAAPAMESSSSSSNDTTMIASAANHLDFLGAMNAMQYGGRRTGRPRYRGGNQNPDGSNKYEFFGGVGLTAPVGNTHEYYTPDWGIQVGAGRNFSDRVGVNVEFNWDNLNLQGKTLLNQQNLYNNFAVVFCTNNPLSQYCSGGTPNYNGLDAYSHIWSFSLQPVYKIPVNEGLGAYLTGGVGFYHKITTFTVPGTGYYCDPYYGYCYQYSANQPVDSYTSNAPGFNAGLGLTYKFSRFSNERFYVEARYVYMLNSARAGVNAATCTSTTCAAANLSVTNDFPANSNRTSYIPIKVGLRF